MAAMQKNQLFDPGFLFTPSDSFSLGRTVLPQYKTSQTDDDRQTDRQTTDRRHSVPKARPIVRSAKNHGLGQYGAERHYSTLPFCQLCARRLTSAECSGLLDLSSLCRRLPRSSTPADVPLLLLDCTATGCWCLATASVSTGDGIT